MVRQRDGAPGDMEWLKYVGGTPAKHWRDQLCMEPKSSGSIISAVELKKKMQMKPPPNRFPWKLTAERSRRKNHASTARLSKDP